MLPTVASHHPCRAVPCRRASCRRSAPDPSAAAAESHGAALAGVQVHRGHRLVAVALAARAWEPLNGAAHR